MGLHACEPKGIRCGIGFEVTAKGIAMLRDDINNALKTAMKAQDARKVLTLRMVNSTIKNADIEACTSGKTLGDDELNAVLAKMIKQRQEFVELYDKGGRVDLAGAEREEIAIISSFLLQQLTEDEIKAAVVEAVKEIGAASVKDMGRVMATLK